MGKLNLDIKKAIKVSLANNNLTASSFCEKISVTESYFSQVMNKKVSPSMIMIERIAKGFDLSASEFVALGE